MNLYPIAAEWGVIWELLEDSQGVLTPELEEQLQALESRTANAIFMLQDVRENASMLAAALDSKIAELVAKRDKYIKTDELLKNRQHSLMVATGQRSVDNGVHKVSLVTNPLKIVVSDDAMVPSRYKNVEIKLSFVDYEKVKEICNVLNVKVSVDKKQLADIYKASKTEFAGVSYVTEDRLVIK